MEINILVSQSLTRDTAIKQLLSPIVMLFFYYLQHQPMAYVESIIKGKLRVNPFEAYVGSESIGEKIFIYGGAAT